MKLKVTAAVLYCLLFLLPQQLFRLHGDLLQAGQTRRSISSRNSNQLQFHRDVTLLSNSCKHQQQIINLASVSADTALLSRLQQYQTLAEMRRQFSILKVNSILYYFRC